MSGRMFTWDGEHRPVPECATDEANERTAEVVEAEARKAMADLSKAPKRGWDSDRKRAILAERVDRLLDEHAMRLDLEAGMA